MSSIYRREVATENVASNNTQSVMKHSPIFSVRNEEAFREYMKKLHIYLPLYSELIFEFFQGKALTSYFHTDANAALNIVAK